MQTILIGGYYGAGNLGDEAILATIISSLTKRRRDLRFIIASFNPDVTRQRFRVESVHWREIIELAKCAERSDLIIVGGGGLFQDYWGVDPQTYLRAIHGGITTYGTLVKLAKLFGKPCMLYAVGVGPLYSPEARQQTREIFRICTASTVRDRGSLQLLHEIGLLDEGEQKISVLADPAFCLEPDKNDSIKAAELIDLLYLENDAPLVGISLRYWEHGIPLDEWTTALAGHLDEFVQHTGAQLVFTPFQIDSEGKFTNDAAVNRLVISKMLKNEHTSIFDKVSSPGIIQTLYRRCDLVIGMRLHAIILSLNAKTPVAAIAYDPKIQALMDEIGLGQFCSLINSLHDFPNILSALWEKRDEVKSKITEITPERKRLAEKNAEIALTLLDRTILDHDEQEPIQFAFERLEQMVLMDKELKEEKDQVVSLREKFLSLNAENLGLKSRIVEMENSRGWRLLESFRKMRSFVSGIFSRGT